MISEHSTYIKTTKSQHACGGEPITGYHTFKNHYAERIISEDGWTQSLIFWICLVAK
jgi:hypothetical protein